MRTSCIQHPANSQMIRVYQWQVDTFNGDTCAAKLLSFFEYWHNIKLNHAEMEGKEEDPRTLIQHHAEPELETGLFVDESRKKIRQSLKAVLASGAVTTEKNPYNPHDRTRHFLFHPSVAQKMADSWDEIYKPHQQKYRSKHRVCIPGNLTAIALGQKGECKRSKRRMQKVKKENAKGQKGECIRSFDLDPKITSSKISDPKITSSKISERSGRAISKKSGSLSENPESNFPQQTGSSTQPPPTQQEGLVTPVHSENPGVDQSSAPAQYMQTPVTSAQAVVVEVLDHPGADHARIASKNCRQGPITQNYGVYADPTGNRFNAPYKPQLRGGYPNRYPGLTDNGMDEAWVGPNANDFDERLVDYIRQDLQGWRCNQGKSVTIGDAKIRISALIRQCDWATLQTYWQEAVKPREQMLEEVFSGLTNAQRVDFNFSIKAGFSSPSQIFERITGVKVPELDQLPKNFQLAIDR